MKHTKERALSGGIGKGFAVGGMLIFGVAANGTTLIVPGIFPTIQTCIDGAKPGDECVVASGTYHELINFNGNAITLHSSDGPEVTIIDAGPVAAPDAGKTVIRC